MPSFMKKTILKCVSIVLAISLLATQSFTSYARTVKLNVPTNVDETIFTLDENQLNSELAELNELEAFLETNQNATYADLADSHSLLISNIDESASPMGMGDQDKSGPPLGIPSFIWGCLLGVIGILLVYILTDQDKAETKKALWGCVTWTVIYVVLYVAWFATWETAN